MRSIHPDSTIVVRVAVMKTHTTARVTAVPAPSIEKALRTWRDASWVDFDPVGLPRWIDAPPKT